MGAGYRWQSCKLEDDPMKKLLMIGALAFVATTAANSAMAGDFYVVRDASTKKCTVVDTKPTTTTTTVVDNGTYKTKTEAETGMKTTKVCTE
jgi:N-methylhydantoinase A/oxoprolinase/acetone carboxylase beta subunit